MKRFRDHQFIRVAMLVELAEPLAAAYEALVPSSLNALCRTEHLCKNIGLMKKNAKPLRCRFYRGWQWTSVSSLHRAVDILMDRVLVVGGNEKNDDGDGNHSDARGVAVGLPLRMAHFLRRPHEWFSAAVDSSHVELPLPLSRYKRVFNTNHMIECALQ